MPLAGQSVRGGLFGSYPSLDELDEGDLVFSTDYRAVYATLLEQWLGCPSAPLLGAKFPQLDLIKAASDRTLWIQLARRTAETVKELRFIVGVGNLLRSH
jgi:hypothetical protein